MVFNMDGFGARAVKLAEYHDLARYRRFPIGMKLFYTSDKHRLTPTEAMRLQPHAGGRRLRVTEQRLRRDR